MHATKRERGSGLLRASALSLAVALGTAGCAGASASGHGSEAPPLQPFQIRTIQRALGVRDLDARPTGVWDEPTRAATAKFQASKGLRTTGELDHATARELGVSLDPMYNCETNDTIDCSPPAD